MRNAWSVLGVARSADRAEIRRAYARKLKTTNPEDDAEGFQALREAYDFALAWVDRQAAWAAHQAAQAEAGEPAEEDEISPLWGEEPANAGDGGLQLDATEAPVAEGVCDAEPERSAGAPHRRPDGRLLPPEGGDLEVAERQPLSAAAIEAALKADAERARLEALRQAAAAEARAEEEAHAALCERLRLLVMEGPSTPRAVLDAYDAVLASAAMDQVAVHERTERWLVGLIVHGAPRSNAILEAAVARFGWDDPRLGHNPGGPVLARREDLEVLRRLSWVESPRRRALKALTQKPKGRRWAMNRLHPSLGRDVRDLLALLRAERPGLIADLDPEAVAWWDAYFDKPRLGPLSFWLMVATPLLLAVVLNPSSGGVSTGPGFLPTYAATLGGMLAVVLGRLYLVEWGRVVWARDHAARAPAWQRLGWAPAALAVAVLAILLPGAGVLTTTLTLLGAVTVLWATITGQPDRAVRGSDPFHLVGFFLTNLLWRADMRHPWQLRALFAYAYLGLFWLLVVGPAAPEVWNKASAPLLAAAATFVLGGQSLVDAWRGELSARTRFGALAVAAVLAVLAAVLFWLSAPIEALRAPVFALAAVLVLVHKAPAADLEGRIDGVREALMRYGWFGTVILYAVVGELAGGVRYEAEMLLAVGGWWLLGGVLTTFVARAWAERRALAPKRPQAAPARKRA